MRNNLVKLQHKIGIIYNIMGRKTRIRRGLANFIGSGLKTLFGTMDDQDASYYEKAVNTIKVNEVNGTEWKKMLE